MKPKNKQIYSADQEYLKTLKEEYFQLGFDTELVAGKLTVFTIKRKKPKDKESQGLTGKRR